MTPTQDWLHTQLATLTSHEAWLNVLRLANKFPTYSFTNQILILIQNPHASYVTGYRSWQRLNRYVQRGEKALRIIAPPIRHTSSDSSDVHTDSSNSSQVSSGSLVGFRPVSVFDLSQTAGEPFTPPDAAPLQGQEAATWLSRLIAASPVPITWVSDAQLQAAHGSCHNPQA